MLVNKWLSLLLWWFAAATSTSLVESSQIPLCTGLGYNIGSWVSHKSNTASNNFECCESTDSHEEFKSMIPSSSMCHNVGNKTIPLGNDKACHCRNQHYYVDQKGTKSLFRHKAIDYSWVPTDCSITPWDEIKFCELLGSRKVLLVGDSTMSQTHTTLQSMIFYSDQFLNLTRKLECMKQISFGMSDYLVNVTRGERGSTLLAHAMNYDYDFDFLIYSYGYHAHEVEAPGDAKKAINDDSYSNFFTKRLQEAIQQVRENRKRKHRPPVSLIYKTENMAHSSCEKYKAPDNSLLNREKLERLSSTGLGKKYQWSDEFHLEDRLIKFARENDVFIMRQTPLYARPDGHIPLWFHNLKTGENSWDCMHYCIPGPLNIFGQLFLHFLTVSPDYWRHED
jgi:hypothetical protein